MSNILTEILEQVRKWEYRPDRTPKLSEERMLTEALAKIEEHYISKSDLQEAIPEKKTIVLDRPLDVDEGEQFCVECGQWTYEGEIDCKCGGYNQAIDDFRTKLNIKEGK